MEIKILFEDENILAINKPAGLVVHPDGRTKEPSISEWFGVKYPKSKNVGEKLGDIERPGIVHRIDRETSGVLLLAKTDAGHALLKKQFQDREIEKTYHTFLYGNLKDNHGTIDQPIARSKNDFRKRVVVRGTGGGGSKSAVTYFEVLKRFEGVTFVEAKPKTGRTHQIRVHFQALHHPVVSDKLYAPKKEPILGFSRLALHARRVTFTDLKGEKHTVEAPYPEDFREALEKIAYLP